MTENIENILILDTETTDLPENECKICELGVILFNIPTRTSLASVSFLVPVENNPAEKINKIPTKATQKIESDLISIASSLIARMSFEFVVAHNADYDKRVLQTLVEDWGFGVPQSLHWLMQNLLEKKWICSCRDIDWSCQQKPMRDLIRLALDYGVPVTSAHRALNDCNLLAAIMERETDLETLLETALEPRQLYIAGVTFEDRDLAKDAGFIWNRLVPKKWAKYLRLSEISKNQFAFPVYIKEDLDL